MFKKVRSVYMWDSFVGYQYQFKQGNSLRENYHDFVYFAVRIQA